MVLKSQVEWALHCCAILAGLPAGKYLATRDLAELHGLPKEYLSKALQGLSQAGLVLSTLGPSGGYRLAKAPAEINFLDIIEAIEGKQSTFVCTEIRKNNPCRKSGTRDGKSCAVARVMWKADQAWRASLRETTLAELVGTLEEDVPATLWKETFAWVTARI